jgi:fructoselysine 6-kinase
MPAESNAIRVAVVGDNTIDRYLGGGDDADIDYVGGNAVNVAVQLSRRRTGVAYFGAVGADADGAIIEEALRRASLDVTGLVRLAGLSAVTRIRRTGTGDRVFESEEFGVTADYRPDAEAVMTISTARWVHLGMLPGAADLVRMMKARDPSLPISQDCSVSTGFRGLAVAFDSAGENETRAMELARTSTAGGAALAVVTMGARGAIAFDGTTWWQQDACPARVVDTTGAGDSFTAGFIDARLDGATVPEALAAGAEWAARTCEHLAGFPQ